MCPLHNRRSGLPIRNCFLFYKQLIRPITEYAYPTWTRSARSPVHNMYMVQASATAGNKQIHEDLNVQFLAKHVGILRVSSTSQRVWGNPLIGSCAC